VTPERISAARFLDREVSEDYLREWAAHIAADKKVIESCTKSVVIFRIGMEWLALPTGVFQEVAEQCRVHTLPHHRGGILRGLVNIRGELLLVGALEILLGIEKVAHVEKTSDETSGARLLVCNRSSDRLAFPVAEVYGVQRYDPRDLRQVPATLAKAAQGAYTVGILPWKGRTVGCLDDELLFYALNKGLT